MTEPTAPAWLRETFEADPSAPAVLQTVGGNPRALHYTQAAPQHHGRHRHGQLATESPIWPFRVDLPLADRSLAINSSETSGTLAGAGAAQALAAVDLSVERGARVRLSEAAG